MSSVSTGSSITDKFTQISRSPPAYQTTNVNHMTQIPPITNTSPKSQSTTGSHVSEQPSSTRFLYQKQTTAGSLLHDRAASTLHDGKIFRPYLKKKLFKGAKFILWTMPITAVLVLIHTLGARDFSSAVSGFCQVFIVTRAREKPLVPRVPYSLLRLKKWLMNEKITASCQTCRLGIMSNVSDNKNELWKTVS